MANTVFIYGLVCPVKEQVFYVGKSPTPARRYKDHLRDCREPNHARSDKSFTEKQLWIQSLQEQELWPQLVILEELKHDGCSHRSKGPNMEVEHGWIRYLRDEGHPLTNTLPYPCAALEEEQLLDEARARAQRMFGS